MGVGIGLLGGSSFVLCSIMAMSAYSPTLSSANTNQATSILIGLRSSLRTPSHMVPRTLANRIPGPSPWKELALAGIQDANRCGQDVSMSAIGVKSVLATMDSTNRAILVKAEAELVNKTE